jgi:hypothetical protein
MNRPRLEGYFEQRWTPGGRFVGICYLTFGRARIVVSRSVAWYDDSW